ncbi:nucleic acid-binding, OB-fold, replication protein A, OB domain protein [Tanacetum coccineum]
MIKELTSLQDDWCIKVRIIRLWKLMAFKNPMETWKIEMVLQDEEKNKIVATVMESICPKFEKCLEEGKCFYISTFSVGDSQGTPKIVENKNKIHIYKATDVTPCETYSGPVHGFRSIENRSHEGEDHCVTHLTTFSSYSVKNDFLNNLLIENRSHEGEDHCVTHLTTFSSYSVKKDFLNNLSKVCINDIRDIRKAMSYVVVATVKKIERESDWWYLACVKCNHKANQDTITEKNEYGVVVKKRIVFMCTNKVCGKDTDVEYKYKIPLRVMDSTGSVSLTLFDRQAHPIIDKSAAEVLQEVRKGDKDILPTDFNKLLENIYAFKVNIKDFNIEKDKHTYGISQLTNDTDIINEPIKRESDDQPACSSMSPPSGSKLAMVNIPYTCLLSVLSITGDNMALRDDEKSTTTSPEKSKLLNVIDADNDSLFSSTKKKLLSPKKEKEDK